MTPTLTTPRALTIVGPGKVGRSLARAAEAAGLEADLLGRAQIESGRTELAEDAPFGSRLVFLAVPDSQIEAACDALCRIGPPPGPVGHLSGATGLEALAAAQLAGVPTFSLHPLQTFAHDRTELCGIPCAVTAEDAATQSTVTGLAELLGMEPFALADEDRVIYHAAASIASNFLVCLEQTASELLAEIGTTDARRLLTPLATQTLSNWSSRGAAALTGPIARGDEETVRRHVEELERRAPQLVAAYLALAERTRALAEARAADRADEAPHPALEAVRA